jgi:hypothetical protein
VTRAESAGNLIGSPGPVSVELHAPPGYVVSGLRAEVKRAAAGDDAAAQVAGFRAIYQRLTGMRLDRGSERVSEWVGGRAPESVVVGNQGRLVYGVYAKAVPGANVEGLGLIQLGGNEGPREVDLLPRIDPVKNVVKAGDVTSPPQAWARLEGGSLASPPSGKNLIEIPCQPPEEYAFEVEFDAPLEGVVAQSLYARGRAFRWVMSTRQGSGFEKVRGLTFDKAGDPSEAACLRPGVKYRSTVRVKDGRVVAEVTEMNPKGIARKPIHGEANLGELTQQEIRRLSHDSWLGLGTNGTPSPVVFTRVKLIEPADVQPTTRPSGRP